MLKRTQLWVKRRYYDIVNSIAFYPAFIALIFLLVAFGSIAFDFSETGKQIKSSVSWLTLKDASTTRVIISTIVAGILSLTVFSFSMVMIVLNQAASQMSNRILDRLIGNRFQQMVLGIYIGTIVFALFLLSTIRDIESHLYIPALSTYLLILITIFDIFLFIYFLHYITQSVKYEVIINRLYENTKSSMEAEFRSEHKTEKTLEIDCNNEVNMPTSGLFEGFDEKRLLKFCSEHDAVIHLLHHKGTFLLKNEPVARINKSLEEDKTKYLTDILLIQQEERIGNNSFYGFKQLMEIALRALSPGINDPGTAIVSLRSMFVLLAKRSKVPTQSNLADEDGTLRIITKEFTLEEVFKRAILPIWDYGKEDRSVRWELKRLLTQYNKITHSESANKLLREVDKLTEEWT